MSSKSVEIILISTTNHKNRAEHNQNVAISTKFEFVFQENGFSKTFFLATCGGNDA